MLFKRLLTGVMSIMMISGMCISSASAVSDKNASTAASTAAAKKTTDYQAYAASLDKTTYSGSDLGAVYTKDKTTFKVWSPKASSVKVNLYEHGSDSEGDAGSFATKSLTLDKKTGVWSVGISGDLAGKYYTYTVKNGDSVKETYDVYAKGCGVNGTRSMVVDFSKTNPDGWEDDKHILVSNPTQASVWEVSVADFSSSESSGVSEANRGKFLAFTEEGTTVNGIEGGTSTCVDYLKKLGVKYVQIMPFYDFGSIDESKDIMEQYNWGYDPVNYNCPEGSYSSNPYDGYARIKECKAMIQALHNAGIGVIMDVVYNHTFSTESAFQYTVPNYYYRMNSDGTFSNGSGCSNDTASEHLMFRKYMIDSVTYWAKEYHIDGFRFDLMGLHDVTTLNNIRNALDNLYDDGSGEKIIMYGEAWDMATNCDSGTVLATQSNLTKLNKRIGAFNDTVRDAIKGSTFGAGGGFVQDGSSRSKLKIGIEGQSNSISGWASAPTQCVTYASCHDNLCLYDKLVDTVHSGEEYRKRYEDLVAMNKLTGAIVITSQGIPFMLSGEEFARSKDGDENSYASSREENMLDWTNLDDYSDVWQYYRGLYQIRDNFAAFSDSTSDTANNNIKYIENVDSGVVAYTINNTETGKWKTLCVIFNGSETETKVSVDGSWVKIADDQTAGLRNLGEVSGSVSVPAHSAIIMVDKNSFNSADIKSSEGAVVISYYDNDSKELIKKQTLTGELGTSYDVKQLAGTFNYDIKEASGDIQGEFADIVLYAQVYVEEYEGNLSTVVFKFVDEVNGSELADSISVTNREGQKYYTPEIPYIENYRLLLDSLPDNASGVLNGTQTEVIYKFTPITGDADASVCTVNAIYMDDNGNIIETNTITGAEGEAYILPDNEYEDLILVKVPDNANGVFAKGEINVIFSYSSDPDPYKSMMTFVYIGAGLVLALCAFSVIYNRYSVRKKFIAEMDIEENAN